MCCGSEPPRQPPSPSLLSGARPADAEEWIVEFQARGADGKPITQRVPNYRQAQAVMAVAGGRAYPASQRP